MNYGLPGPGGHAQDYGAAPNRRASPQKSRPVTMFTVIIVFFLPCIIFAMAAAAYSVYFDYLGALVSVITALHSLFLLACAFVAFVALKKSYLGDSTHPFWYIFLTVSVALAMLLGLVLARTNWNDNIVQYNMLSKLTVATGIDPSTTSGQQLMDAGKVSFISNSTTDVNISIGFKNGDTYCVAPIVTSPAVLLSATQKDGSVAWMIDGRQNKYDFWAVGLNCCSGGSYKFDFHCGDSLNSMAHDGLRLLDEKQAATYRVAVEAAEASYSISAPHPTFFFWVKDANAEHQAYRDMAMTYLTQGIIAFSTGQALAVLAGVFYKTKPRAFDWE